MPLRSGESVNLIVVRRADPSRWDMKRLAECGDEEELTLSEQGIQDWAAKLDVEDQR